MNRSKPQKNRTRRIPLVRFLLLVCVLSLAWHFCGRYELGASSRGATPGIAIATPPPAVAPAVRPEPFVRIVKPGDTFAGILGECGVSGAHAIRYYTSLVSLGLSAIFPGDSIVIARNEANEMESFSLLSRMRCWYRLRRDSLGFQAEKQPLATTVYRCLVKGELRDCLSADLFELGVGDALVAKMTDIFAWDINFFVDPRKGDRFEALFEKNYIDGVFAGYGDILAARYVNKGREFYAIGVPDSLGKLSYYDRDGKSVQKQFLKAPLRFSRISSGYTYRRRHPILGIVRPHLGIDYAAPRGTPVYASADGTISFAGRKGGYGNLVKIRHGASFETYYGHLHRIARGVRPGARVAQGDLVGLVGSTGLSTGPHLDYRMKKGRTFVNPLSINLPSKGGIAEYQRAAFAALRHARLTAMAGRRADSGCVVLEIQTPDTPAVEVVSGELDPANG
jgi:murein DD-endopeptidase MepM/ murein hydrolase activator NlpD